MNEFLSKARDFASLKVMKAHPHAHLPECNDLFNAGFDLYAVEDVQICAGQAELVPLGIKTEFSPGLVGIIKDRSSVAMSGLVVHAGVIDSGYRGEWKVLLRNMGELDARVCRGERVAQVIFMMKMSLSPEWVDDLSSSRRGAGGFGSTGK